MLPTSTHARHLAVFLAALIGWNHPAVAASVISFEFAPYLAGDENYDPLVFNVYFDEEQVYYDSIYKAQVAKAYAADIPGLSGVHQSEGQIDFFFGKRRLKASGNIYLYTNSYGLWPIDVSVIWDNGLEIDSYWMFGGAPLFPNDRSPPNFLVGGSWLAEPEDFYNWNLFYLFHAFIDTSYNFYPDYYFSLNTVTIAAAPEIPEPATWMLMLLGLGAVGLAIRRQRTKLAVS